MSEDVPDFKPVDLKEHTKVAHPDADSIGFVTVPGEDKVFLYLWDTEADQPVTWYLGVSAEGMAKLQEWMSNVDIEARQARHTGYGDGDE